ncbi:hypothetical protein ABH931_006131 [Streptacidiphilus sp. MAP12-33]|uniref:hypothetical protein n=1 Tax=Streptacidiphilus sp. MAP12-33 TaxID=3156266 RepID=UPI00351167CA
MSITRMLALRKRLATPAPRARLLPCGWCYEENGEEVHPHPECPIGQPAPRPVPAPPLTRLVDRHADDLLALSELQGRMARMTDRLERVAESLEARHVRYGWTVRLREELLAIAHDTPTSMGG